MARKKKPEPETPKAPTVHYCELCGWELPPMKRSGNPMRFCRPGTNGSRLVSCKQVMSKLRVFSRAIDSTQFPPTAKGEAAAMILRNTVKDIEEGLRQQGIRLHRRREAKKAGQASLFS